MSENRASGTPRYALLGTRLKCLREQCNESLGEVSGAVEIDIDKLERIEQGSECPSEDILVLLINHFGMKGQEAMNLWELAGYDSGEAPEKLIPQNEGPAANKPVVMFMAMDMRTIYTDGVAVTATQSGVTIEFTQNGPLGQPSPVAKLGMSCEQAEQVIKTLQQSLLKAKYADGCRTLPASIKSAKPRSKKQKYS